MNPSSRSLVAVATSGGSGSLRVELQGIGHHGHVSSKTAVPCQNLPALSS